MFITAALVMMITWCLFYGSLPNILLAIICLGLGTALALMNRHGHEGMLSIDIIAQQSELNHIHPTFKFWIVLILMCLCLMGHSPWIGLLMAFVVLIILVGVGKLPLHDYMAILSAPLVFLILSGLALLFDVHHSAEGLIHIPLLNGFLVVTQKSQAHALLVMSKALGAVSCLYLLSLTTPMSELIGVMRRIRVPQIMIELMYLIYRYTFVLFDMYRIMKNATKSRLGFIDYRTSVRTTGQIYMNLMARSYQKALQNYDAMESRCYTGEICFLEREKPLTKKVVLAFSSFVIAVLIMVVGSL